MKHDIKSKDECVERNGWVFYSVKWIARYLDIEAGTVRRFLQEQLTWPVPFYQAKSKGPLYVEFHNITRMHEAAKNIEARGIARRSKDPVIGNKDGKWAKAWRLEVLGMNLWTPEQMAARGKQTRDKYGNVCNPPLSLPAVDKGPDLFLLNEIQQFPIACETSQQLQVKHIDLSLSRPEIIALLKHCKSKRPHETRGTTTKIRRLLMEQQIDEYEGELEPLCQVCWKPLVDDGKKTAVDHKRGISEVANSIMEGRLTLDQGYLVYWRWDDLRALHTKCNHATAKRAAAEQKEVRKRKAS